MVPRLIRRRQMDDRLPVAQINLCQMVLLSRFVFDSCCFSGKGFEARVLFSSLLRGVRGDGTPTILTNQFGSV